MESELESDEVILHRTTTEIHNLKQELRKTKLLKSSVLSQLPVGMKASDSILQKEAKSFDSEMMTLQAEKEKKRFSKLRIVIMALLAAAIVLIAVFIVLMFII